MIRKLLKLLPIGYRKKIYPVAASILASTVLNLIGIAVILPIFILLLGGGELSNYPFIAKFQSLFAVESPKIFIVWLSLGIIIVLVLKYLLSQVLLKYQTKYVLSIYCYFSDKLLNSYYRKGYLFIKENGTTDLTYKINSVCYAAATLVFQPILNIAAEGTIAVVTFACIVALSPFAALALIASLIPAVIVYNWVIRTKLSKFGRLENRARNRQFGIVTEIFGSFPSVELNQAFPKMHSRFEDGLGDISELRLRATLISRFPNFLIEIAIILCVSLLLLVSGQDWSSLSLSLACFCAGALRILPAVRSVMTSHTQIKNNSYAVDTITQALDNEPTTEIQSEVVKFNSEIKVENLTFGFPDRGKVLDNLSFTIHKGERVGIRGVSGSGKSTLFNILLGLYDIQKGRVLIDDQALSPENRHEWQKLIGYVPQDVSILNASIAENVAFSVAFHTSRFEPLTIKELLYDKPQSADHFSIPEDILQRIELCLEQAQLSDFVASLPDGIFTIIGENGCKLSGGQRQRIGIARALFKNPQLLFFDEATSSLDTEMEKEVNKAITDIAEANKELTMLIIAHRPDSLAICDKIIDI